MHGCGYLSGRISVSRFNRRLHQLADWMAWIPDVLGEVRAGTDGIAWAGLDSGRVGGGVHHGRRVHYR